MTIRRSRVSAAVVLAGLVLIVPACGNGAEPLSVPSPATSLAVDPEESAGIEIQADEEAATATSTTTEAPVANSSTTTTTTTSPPPLTDPPHAVEFAWGNFRLAEDTSNRLFEARGLRFVLTVSDTTAENAAMFEQGWALGIEEVATLSGRDVVGQMVGPEGGDALAQADELTSLVETGEVDCLAVDAADRAAVPDAIDAAVAAGIPVFAVGDDAANSRRFAFYGLDDFEAGRFAGSHAGQWVRDSRILIRKAAVLAGDPDDPSSRARMEGFIEAFLEFQPHVEFTNGPESTEAQGFDADEVYDSSVVWLQQNPDADMIFHADEGLEFLARAIGDQLLYGNVYAIGFGMSQTVGNLIHDGVVLATLLEGYEAQAAAAARACGDFLFDGVYDVGVVSRDPQVVHEHNLEAAGWNLAGTG